MRSNVEIFFQISRTNFFGSSERNTIDPPANLTRGIFRFEPSEIEVAKKYLVEGVLK